MRLTVRGSICCCDVTVLYGCVICSIFFGYIVFFVQAEDGIRDLVRSRGLGDVYKRQVLDPHRAGGGCRCRNSIPALRVGAAEGVGSRPWTVSYTHLTLPTIYSV